MSIIIQDFHKEYKRWAWQINDNVTFTEDIKLFRLDAKDTSYVSGVMGGRPYLSSPLGGKPLGT